MSGSLGTSHGFYQSTDGGVSWRNESIGLPSDHVSAVAISPSQPHTLYTGILHWEGHITKGVYHNSAAQSIWQDISSGLPLTTSRIKLLVTHPADPLTLYAGTDGDSAAHGMYRTTNGGTSWAAINTGLPLNARIRAFAIDPASPSKLYTATDKGVYRSVNGGDTWSSTGVGLLSNVYITSLVINPKTPSVLYAAGDGIYRSNDSGVSWQVVIEPYKPTIQAGLPTYTLVNSMVIDPVTPSILYIGTNTGGTIKSVYRSTDSGASWSESDTGLSGPIVLLLVDPKKPSRLYAGTYQGLYFSDNSGATWRCISLPNEQVTALAIHPEDSNLLYIGSRRGLFVQTPVPSEQVQHSFLSLIKG